MKLLRPDYEKTVVAARLPNAFTTASLFLLIFSILFLITALGMFVWGSESYAFALPYGISAVISFAGMVLGVCAAINGCGRRWIGLVLNSLMFVILIAFAIWFVVESVRAISHIRG